MSGRRDTVAALVAIVLGLAIAWLDSRPAWDDTGVTAGLLVFAATGAAFVGRRRPWLWALLVGAPTPLLEGWLGAGAGALLALVFAGLGAAAGHLLGRVVTDRGGAAA
ncbi:MAG: hypothetical protein ACRDF7_09205 [Candidatus Limnocylindrales bacterium]